MNLDSMCFIYWCFSASVCRAKAGAPGKTTSQQRNWFLLILFCVTVYITLCTYDTPHMLYSACITLRRWHSAYITFCRWHSAHITFCRWHSAYYTLHILHYWQIVYVAD